MESDIQKGTEEVAAAQAAVLESEKQTKDLKVKQEKVEVRWQIKLN